LGDSSELAVGSKSGSVAEPVGLVVDHDGDLLELGLMLTGVVSTEQELPTVEQLNAHVCLSTASIATVGRGQIRSRGYSCVHVGSLPITAGATHLAQHLSAPLHSDLTSRSTVSVV
jgi:hypothetical protein